MSETVLQFEEEKFKFENLFDIAEIQKIQDSFCDVTGVAAIITDVNGKPITKPSNFCKLCQIIRTTKKGLINCEKSDALLGKQNVGGPLMQPCLSGGLWDAGASISVGEKHIATWLVGKMNWCLMARVVR